MSTDTMAKPKRKSPGSGRPRLPDGQAILITKSIALYQTDVDYLDGLLRKYPGERSISKLLRAIILDSKKSGWKPSES